MSSIRRKLRPEDNINDSKNTRMDVAGPLASWKPDELGHISRYTKIADMIIKEAKKLGRPCACVEVGCGNIWVLRHIYKSITVKKADVISRYTGYDIDPACLDEYPGWPKFDSVNQSTWLASFNGHVVIQDMTVNPILNHEDSSVDFFWSTETIEHMGKEFVKPWIEEAHRILREGGRAYISTPNHDGSKDKLPVDHVYEWGYEELKELLEKYFIINAHHGVFGQQRHYIRGIREWYDRITPEARAEADRMIYQIQKRFSPEWQRVILATMFPEKSNNVAWQLTVKK